MKQKLSNKFNAWKRLGLSEMIIVAADKMATTAADDHTAEYWYGVAKFLKDLKYKSFESLSTKQRNWVHNIKMDLKGAGLI